jgi:hypothetical protein
MRSTKIMSLHFLLLIDELLVAAEEDTQSTERTTPRHTGITS